MTKAATITDWIAVATGETQRFPDQKLTYPNQQDCIEDIFKHGKQVARVHDEYMIVYYCDKV